MLFNSEDASQAYLMFQPLYKYFQTVTNTNYISSWKSKGLSAESIKPPATSDLCSSSSIINDPTLKNCLFGAVTLTKNSDIEKYGYSGYGIGFDRRGSFSFPGGGYVQNVLIFGADMSSPPHIDNKKRHISIKI